MYNSSGNQPLYVGYIACLVSVIFFGSNLVIVKKHNTGDGFFFNWVYCSAIWIVGLIINMIEGSPEFYPLAMVGGVLWATGGLCVSLILRYIGLGLGVCIWATFNLIIGWACGRFGLFGLHPRIPRYEALNYIACVLSIISAVFYLSVQTSQTPCSEQEPLNQDGGHHPTLTIDDDLTRSPTSSPTRPDAPDFDSSIATASLDTKIHVSPTPREYAGWRSFLFDPISSTPGGKIPESDLLLPHPSPSPDPNVRSLFNGRYKFKKRLIGSVLAIFSGCLYGVNFVPVIYIQDNYPKSSNKGLPYIFAHFRASMPPLPSTSSSTASTKNREPWVSSALIVPTMISGAMWAIATCAWFVANEILTQTISFPIIASLPAIIAGFWGLVVFKEIRGRRNIVLLMCAFCFSLSGAILSGVSF